MRWHWIWLFLLCFVSVMPVPVAAQNKKASSAELKKAAQRFEEAEAFYALGDYENALSLYREAYLLSKKPELLFNMAQCERQRKHFDEALLLYRSFLRDAPESERRALVEKLIAEVTAEQAAQKALSVSEKQPESLPQPTASKRDFRLPVSFAIGGALLGGSVFFLHQHVKEEGAVSLPVARLGLVLSITTDLSWVASAFTLWRSLR